MIEKLCETALKALDDHRLTPEQRAETARSLHNLRVIQKQERTRTSRAKEDKKD